VQDISNLGVRDLHIWFKKSPSLVQEISKFGARDPEFGVIDIQIWCERSPNLVQEISKFGVRIPHEVWLCNYVFREINAKHYAFQTGKLKFRPYFVNFSFDF
jgi:hypothetical protein